MQKFFIAILIVTMAVSCASAEKRRPLNIYIQGGALLPSKDTLATEGYFPGYNMGFGVGYNINDHVEIVGRILHHTMSPNFSSDFWWHNLRTDEDVVPDGGEFRFLMYGGELKLNATNKKNNCYLIAGLGIIDINIEAVTGEYYTGEPIGIEKRHDLDGMFNFGVGFELHYFFMELRWISLHVDDWPGSAHWGPKNYNSTLRFICMGIKF